MVRKRSIFVVNMLQIQRVFAFMTIKIFRMLSSDVTYIISVRSPCSTKRATSPYTHLTLSTFPSESLSQIYFLLRRGIIIHEFF